jgi:hypothetical protein
MATFGRKSKVIRPAKIFCEAHNFVPRRDFDEQFFRVNCGTLQMWIAASRE